MFRLNMAVKNFNGFKLNFILHKHMLKRKLVFKNNKERNDSNYQAHNSRQGWKFFFIKTPTDYSMLQIFFFIQNL